MFEPSLWSMLAEKYELKRKLNQKLEERSKSLLLLVNRAWLWSVPNPAAQEKQQSIRHELETLRTKRVKEV